MQHTVISSSLQSLVLYPVLCVRVEEMANLSTPCDITGDYGQKQVQIEHGLGGLLAFLESLSKFSCSGITLPIIKSC